MNIVKSFDAAFKRMKERNWEKIYVLVDIHDTIFEGCYHNTETYKWFPYAKEALDIMSHSIRFDFFNRNSETKNTDLSCFDEKTYFNVGIDDKFGFEAETDWEIIYNYLVEGIRLGKFK